MDGSLFAGLFAFAVFALFVLGTPVYIIVVHIHGWSVGNDAGLSWQMFLFACVWITVVVGIVLLFLRKEGGDSDARSN